MCLEVLEHISPDAEAVALANLRKHAEKGLVLSWSKHGDAITHPNARSWPEVQGVLRNVGFTLDEAASQELRPQLAWMKEAVHIFRVSSREGALDAIPRTDL